MGGNMKTEIAIIKEGYDRQIAAALAQIYDLRDARRAAVEKTEKEMIRQALKACNWRKNKACKALGISINTLWRKMLVYRVRR